MRQNNALQNLKRRRARAIVADARKIGVQIDVEIRQALRSFLSFAQ
jgi:hypothetical protein